MPLLLIEWGPFAQANIPATMQRFLIFQKTHKNLTLFPDGGNIMVKPVVSEVSVHSNYVKQRNILISWDTTAFHLMKNWKTFMSGWACNCFKAAWLSVNQHACYSEVLMFESLQLFFKINLRTERIFLTRSACTDSIWKVSTLFSSRSPYFK